ncbi:ABC transporter permease [Glycomyces artemisiae]|uniref:Mannose ABC transporter membrane protein /fructose ABC transporter membrane protein /ribose ABC transporter membrane protein n=1 Tax=Glycomyces artemisiae TaxID=1076443 RepID=A0A2T0UPU5_9ACTN|nr:ABC transporter permease [Glycomyces artemisiae]PRY59924.1 mannose ABC transporter membrane protein /fructose ABC transporter membrane protein /ribose ABC transporter membrane protein [Glycomyces artemisiae]
MNQQNATAAAEPDLAEEFLDRSTPLRTVRNLLHRHPAISPAIVLIAAVAVFGGLNERFLEPSNLSLVSQQVAVVGTLALAQTLIILTAGIDLSVGAVMVLASMVVAQTTVQNGVPAAVGLVLGLAVGLGAGALNGLLVTRLKLPPFIVTLGSLNVFLALTLLYSGGATVRGGDMPDLLTLTGETFSLGGVNITIGVVMMLVLYVALALILHGTAWGRHVYAAGDDPEAARLAGIRVQRVLASVYLAAGAILAVAAWIQIGRSNAASPNTGVDLNLDSITAVVIGGTSLFGGRGTVWGTLLGALIVGVFRNGLALVGVDILWQTFAVGVLIIAAVSIDQWIRKARA